MHKHGAINCDMLVGKSYVCGMFMMISYSKVFILTDFLLGACSYAIKKKDEIERVAKANR